MSTVGERIRDKRVEMGLTADELAERIGKNRATIYRYESDAIENLPVSVIAPLADILQTTPAYLMGWTEEKPAAQKSDELPDLDRKLISLLRQFPADDYRRIMMLAQLSKAELQKVLDYAELLLAARKA